MEVHDYSGHIEQIDPADVARVIDLTIIELRHEQTQVALLELQLKKAEERVRTLEEVTIPELMESIGWAEGSKLVTPAGNTLVLKRTINASIAAAHREEVFRWLDENGHGGLVKRNVIVPFGRDTEEEAQKLVETLERKYCDVREERKVEPATFSAWVRGQVEAGKSLPPASMINIDNRKVAKLT